MKEGVEIKDKADVNPCLIYTLVAHVVTCPETHGLPTWGNPLTPLG